MIKYSAHIRIILAIMLVSVLAVSCGIRPVPKPHRDIVGWEDTQTEPFFEEPETASETEILPDLTTPVETAPEVTVSVEEEIEEYYREIPAWYTGHGFSNTMRDSLRSYLADPEYIEENTVGIFYIKNKKTGLALTAKYDCEYRLFGYDSPRSSPTCLYDLSVLRDLESQKFRLLRLEKGYYALLSYKRHNTSGHVEYYALSSPGGSVSRSAPLLQYLWWQSWIIEPTESGAYHLRTRYTDQASNKCLSYTRSEMFQLYDHIEPIELHFVALEYEYTDDSDYSDEWLLIPYEP